MKKFTFLIPVYNDWKSLQILLEDIEQKLKMLDDKFEIIILNDFSTQECDISVKKFQKIQQIKIVNFKKNVGSQRAIAIGLKYIIQNNKNNENEAIIIMDSDGQDDPGILSKIIEINKKFPDEVITINRTRRKEPIWFKILYEFHYYALILFTGHKVRYGHYGLISTDKIKKLLLTGNLWAAYPAAVSKSFKKTYKIFHERKQRYAGNTKMNLYKLFIHSLRVFSVFKYKIFTFSLLYSLILTVLVPNFYFFIFLLAIGNFLIFLDSYNNKKKYEDSFNSIIGKIDIIK